jgi:hypothetical protein
MYFFVLNFIIIDKGLFLLAFILHFKFRKVDTDRKWCASLAIGLIMRKSMFAFFFSSSLSIFERQAQYEILIFDFW